MKYRASALLTMLFGLALAVGGFGTVGCKGLYETVPPTYPPGIPANPAANPLPQTRPTDPAFAPGTSTDAKIEAVLTRLNTISQTAAAVSPPGPIQSGALLSSGLFGALITLNSLWKSLKGKPTTPPAP